MDGKEQRSVERRRAGDECSNEHPADRDNPPGNSHGRGSELSTAPLTLTQLVAFEILTGSSTKRLYLMRRARDVGRVFTNLIRSSLDARISSR